MRTKFITPCFCRIEDADKRKEICQQLKRIGYRPSTLIEEIIYDTLITEKSLYYDVNDGCILPDTLAVDCGTNTELFLALAGRRSDTNKGQWFNTIGSEYRKESWHFCNSDQMYDNCLGGEYRKATTPEIIEHFNKPTE